jgi:hypothetical protein
MNRKELEHIIRAAGEIVKVQKIIILGSQAVLAQFPDLSELIEPEDSELSLRVHLGTMLKVLILRLQNYLKVGKVD